MFAKTVTDSDAFVEMPSATQLLYFHLSQAADDDGFNNQIQIAMMKAHASADDLKILLMKRFIIRFESGVIVIKHWRIHNTLRKDRYTPTTFQKELSQLNIKENKSYSLSDTPRLPDGCQTVAKPVPQIRLGKGSTGKGSTGKERGMGETTADKPPEVEPTPYAEIQSLYISLCPSFPRVQTLSANRKKAIHARWVQYGKSLDVFRALFEKAEASDFLKGVNNRNWSADFDWMLKDGNMAKILEGKYDEKHADPSMPTYDGPDFLGR